MVSVEMRSELISHGPSKARMFRPMLSTKVVIRCPYFLAALERAIDFEIHRNAFKIDSASISKCSRMSGSFRCLMAAWTYPLTKPR